MPRRTLADLQNQSLCRIPAALKLCGSDPRYLAILNEAEEMLVEAGAYWGIFVRYRAQVASGLLVWPQEIASILSGSVCNSPIKTRSMSWEFMDMGMGLQSPLDTTTGTTSCCGGTAGFCSSDLLDRGNIPVSTPITGLVSKLKVYCDLPADNAAICTFMGLDENGNEIRLAGGSPSDGEIVIPSVGGTLSTKLFSNITGVIKPVTQGPIRLYAYDTLTALQTALAVYDYDVTNPFYRVSYVPSLDNQQPGSTPITVEVLAKLDFMPMRNPTDFALIGNIPALKAMCVAIADAEKTSSPIEKQAIIQGGLALAKMFLNNELMHFNGAPEDHIQVQGITGPSQEVLETFV